MRLTGRVVNPDLSLWRWPHINPVTEWACHGTGQIVIECDFLDLFEELRRRCGFPLPISSGYRSPEHNQRVSTTGLDGPHTTAKAMDITVYGERAVTVFAVAAQLGYRGFGVSQKGVMAKRFLHLDQARDAVACWSY